MFKKKRRRDTFPFNPSSFTPPLICIERAYQSLPGQSRILPATSDLECPCSEHRFAVSSESCLSKLIYNWCCLRKWCKADRKAILTPHAFYWTVGVSDGCFNYDYLLLRRTGIEYGGDFRRPVGWATSEALQSCPCLSGAPTDRISISWSMPPSVKKLSLSFWNNRKRGRQKAALASGRLAGGWGWWWREEGHFETAMALVVGKLAFVVALSTPDQFWISIPHFSNWWNLSAWILIRLMPTLLVNRHKFSQLPL